MRKDQARILLLRPAGLPCYRMIVALDIEGSTTRTNPMKVAMRRAMYALFEAALNAAGITERHRDRLIDRGDGVFALIHPLDDIPITRLLDTLIPALDRLLAEHNTRQPAHPLRMRAAVHAGEVHYDERGCSGEALDLVFRLLDARWAKKGLRDTPGALVLVISDHMFRSVVRHGYAGIDEDGYLACGTVDLAGRRRRGYLHIPAEQPGGRAADGTSRRPADRASKAPDRPPDRPMCVVRSGPQRQSV